MAPWPAAIGLPLRYCAPLELSLCPPAEGADYFVPDFRIRRTSMKVRAVVTEITEPNNTISIAALSM